jgi:dihydroorotate dehydrogenase electron transfer subunit
MNAYVCKVASVRRVTDDVFVLGLDAPDIASTLLPGQFLNVRVSDSLVPLLRRPFSAYRVNGSIVEIIFQRIGIGTSLLATKREGDIMDVLGPLGHPYSVDATDYDTALLIAGGLGVAPVPLLTRSMIERGKQFVTFLGGRRRDALLEEGLQHLQVATDDGSKGFHGTVVELVRAWIGPARPVRPRIFACGPTPMLRAVAELARGQKIPCEVSLEGSMACGIGICQGCPVELVGEGEVRYALMCKDGPAFDAAKIRI